MQNIGALLAQQTAEPGGRSGYRFRRTIGGCDEYPVQLVFRDLLSCAEGRFVVWKILSLTRDRLARLSPKNRVS
jgi:hypothetical protein